MRQAVLCQPISHAACARESFLSLIIAMLVQLGMHATSMKGHMLRQMRTRTETGIAGIAISAFPPSEECLLIRTENIEAQGRPEI